MPPGEEDKARHFYVDVLGFEELAKPEHLRKRGGVWFKAGSAEVHLGAEDGFRPAKKAHPALLVQDLATLTRQCAEAGFATSTDQPLPGFRRAYLSDPVGNRIELLQPER